VTPSIAGQVKHVSFAINSWALRQKETSQTGAKLSPVTDSGFVPIPLRQLTEDTALNSLRIFPILPCIPFWFKFQSHLKNLRR
jgi:hypothetical protein